MQRADSTKNQYGPNYREKAPHGKIVKSDVSVAKNYLAKDELESLGRIVNAYLDLAEERAKRKSGGHHTYFALDDILGHDH